MSDHKNYFSEDYIGDSFSKTVMMDDRSKNKKSNSIITTIFEIILFPVFLLFELLGKVLRVAIVFALIILVIQLLTGIPIFGIIKTLLLG